MKLSGKVELFVHKQALEIKACNISLTLQKQLFCYELIIFLPNGYIFHAQNQVNPNFSHFQVPNTFNLRRFISNLSVVCSIYLRI